MSKEYRVHVYSVCHAKLASPVKATSHQRAAQKVISLLNAPYGESPFTMEDIFTNQSAAEYVEHDEGGETGFLVDRVGDDGFEESCWFYAKGDKVQPLADPLQMFTVELQQENDSLKSLLHDVLHQISTDTDLDTVTGTEKYKALTARIRAVLPIDI